MRVPFRRGQSLVALLGVLASLGGALRIEAETPVPPKLQVAILSRMLAYDRTFKARAGAVVKIGILSKAGDKGSVEDQTEMVKAFKVMDPPTIQGLPVTATGHSYNDPAALAEWIATEQINAIYVTSALSVQVDAIGLVCAQKKIVSMTGTRSFVEKALAVGVIVKGENPKIVVNLKNAEAVGMSLDSKLLQLAEVIR
jgi:YfiR/HmsC-like